MADIKILSRMVGTLNRNVDLESNTLVVTSLKVGGATNTELTKAILDNLITLQDGSDIAASVHSHDSQYYTETELASTADGSAGATLIGIDQTPAMTNISGANAQALFESIDSAIGTNASNLTDHLDGTANKHDATEIDYERSDVAITATGAIDKTNYTANPSNYPGAAGNLISIEILSGGVIGAPVVLVTGTKISITADTGGTQGNSDVITALNASAPALALASFSDIGGFVVATTETFLAGGDNGRVNIAADSDDVESAISDLDDAVAALGTPAGLAGAGLIENGSALDVNVDGTTLEVNTDIVRVKDDGISSAKILLQAYPAPTGPNGDDKGLRVETTNSSGVMSLVGIQDILTSFGIGTINSAVYAPNRIAEAAFFGTANVTASASAENTGDAFLRSGFILSGAVGGTDGTGSTGDVDIETGSAENGGTSGKIFINTGASSNAAAGKTGDVQIFSGKLSGATNSAATGEFNWHTGEQEGTGVSGQVAIRSGSTAVGSGASGDYYSGSGTSNSGASGISQMASGNSVTGATGIASIRSGSTTAGTGNSGTTEMISGDSFGGDSGLVLLRSGAAASGTRGNVELDSRQDGAVLTLSPSAAGTGSIIVDKTWVNAVLVTPLADISNLEAAVGSSTGTAGMDYSSNNYVADSDSAKVAIGKIDAQVKINADAIVVLQAGLVYRGTLAAGSDVTGNATGNTYLDGGTGLITGDFFKITGSGVITTSDGTIAIDAGDMLIANKDVASDAAIVNADFDKIDNTEAANILREGDLAAGEMFLGSAGNIATAVTMSGDVSLSNTGVASVDNVNGSSIQLATNPGLEDSTGLRVKIKAASGIVRDGDGLSVNLGDFDTDALSEGATNLYFTEARVRATLLTGFTSGAGVVAATDSVLQAFQKIDANANAAQADADTAQGDIDSHTDGGASKHDATEIDYEALDAHVNASLAPFTGMTIDANASNYPGAAGNAITIVTVDTLGGGGAGGEVATVVGTTITVSIESGVTVQSQLKDAIDANSAATDLVSVTTSNIFGLVTVISSSLAGGITGKFNIQASSDDVELAIADLDKAIYDSNSALADHIADTADAHDASAIGYTPSTLADWTGSADPGETDDALDQLASRMVDVEADNDSSKVEEIMVAGETFAANTSFFVRIALDGETAGRVYKADHSAGAAGSETNTIYVIGLAQNRTGSAINAAGNIPVVKLGEAILQSADTAFTATQDEGLPIYAGAAGAFSLSASSTVDDAILLMGSVRNVGGSSAIEISQRQIIGIN